MFDKEGIFMIKILQYSTLLALIGMVAAFALEVPERKKAFLYEATSEG